MIIIKRFLSVSSVPAILEMEHSEEREEREEGRGGGCVVVQGTCNHLFTQFRRFRHWDSQVILLPHFLGVKMGKFSQNSVNVNPERLSVY